MSTALLERYWRDADPVEEGRKLLRLVVKMYRPRAVWAMCSGGNDSLCATHLAMSTGLVTGVASINTTAGIAVTREHMQSVADKFGWPLRWLTPPMSYEQCCAKWGMPGPGGHNLIYQRLKERCVRQLVRESKRRPKDRVVLVSGCRIAESERRMGHTQAIQREGARMWCAPILNWDEQQKVVYQIASGIPRNPVKPVLGVSGECMCGAFAKPGERQKFAEHYPEDFERVVLRCERAAAANGQPCGWGERPRKNQMLCQQCDRKNGDGELAEVA